MDENAQARIDMIKPFAAMFNVDPALIAAVCEQESGWNQWAMRYEPMFYTKYIQPMVNKGTVSSMTEATARATSFGLMQVMGEVARELGFTGKWLTELCDPAVGVKYGSLKLSKCLAATAGDKLEALQRYNGGGNPSYGHEVVDRMVKYQE